jgi:hypothetical protein
MTIIPANPGFEILIPNSDLRDYEKEPIIGWHFYEQCLEGRPSSSQAPEPVTPNGRSEPYTTAIRFPDGTIYQADLPPYRFEGDGDQAAIAWFAALKSKPKAKT